jgi:hypothetical protein
LGVGPTGSNPDLSNLFAGKKVLKERKIFLSTFYLQMNRAIRLDCRRALLLLYFSKFLLSTFFTLRQNRAIWDYSQPVQLPTVPYLCKKNLDFDWELA